MDKQSIELIHRDGTPERDYGILSAAVEVLRERSGPLDLVNGLNEIRRQTAGDAPVQEDGAEVRAGDAALFRRAAGALKRRYGIAAAGDAVRILNYRARELRDGLTAPREI